MEGGPKGVEGEGMDPWALEEGGFAAQLQALAPKDPLVLAVSGEGGFRGPPLPRPPDGAARGGGPDGPPPKRLS